MAYRSVWKGFLKLGFIACPIKLYAATGEPAGVSFTYINPKTGNRLEFVRRDAETGAELEFKDIAKGVEVSTGCYVEVGAEEIAAVAPPSIHTLEIRELVPPAGIDWLFPALHYYAGPDGAAAGEAFALLHKALARSRLTALGQLTMGLSEHLVAITPGRNAFRLSTLRYAAEVRSEDAVFPDLADLVAPAELIAPVETILRRRAVEAFEPARFADRYAAALAELIRDKITGKMVKRTVKPPPRLIDLRKAVKRSVALKPDRRAKSKSKRAA